MDTFLTTKLGDITFGQFLLGFGVYTLVRLFAVFLRYPALMLLPYYHLREVIRWWGKKP